MTQLCQLSSKFFLVAFRGKCFVSPCLFNGFPHKKKIITSKTAKYSLPSTLAGFFRQFDSFKLLCTQFLLSGSRWKTRPMYGLTLKGSYVVLFVTCSWLKLITFSSYVVHFTVDLWSVKEKQNYRNRIKGRCCSSNLFLVSVCQVEQVADALDSFRNLIIVSFDFDLVGSCLAFIDVCRQLEYTFLEIFPGAHLNLFPALFG